MTSLVEVATYWPKAVKAEAQCARLGVPGIDVRRFVRAFGFDEVRWDPAESEADLMLGAARKLAQLPGQEERVRYVVRARTVRSPSPYPLSPLAEVRRALGLQHAQTFAVTDHACASGLLAVDLAGMLVDCEPRPDALALVLTGEKAFSRHTQLVPGVALLGEATSAILVGAGGAGDRVLGFATRTHPMPAAGLVMDDQDYAQFSAVYGEALTGVVHAALDPAGLTMDDVALLLPHNVGRRAWSQLAGPLRIPLDRIFMGNVSRTGHCFAADPFLNYRTAADLGLLRSGDRYVMTSVGLGATFSAMVLEH